MTEWTYASAADTAKALAAKKVSSVELTQQVIGRIERFDKQLNAVCVRDFDRALEAARAADAAIAKGEKKPLLGVPVTIKESFNLAGTATTWGFPHGKDYIAPEDALAVTRVKDAGAVIVGKTNVPQALADWQSYNAIYGTSNNPYDLTRTPGGSSGGSAAALAAGYGSLSLGSDIGGSLRVPAHFCGVTAHKPTWNLAPSRGQTPPFIPALPGDIDLAVIGPMARNVGDLVTVLDIIAGPDPLSDGGAYTLALPPARHEFMKDFRVLVLDSHPLSPISKAVSDGVARVEEVLRKGGAKVERSSAALPDLAENGKLYMRLLLGTLGATFPPDIYENITQLVKTLDPNMPVLAAERLRGMVMSHRDWFFADAARRGLRMQWRAFFQQFDAVVCPVLPTPAFPHDHSENAAERALKVDDKIMIYQDQLLWPGVATLPGLPATSIPAGLSNEGLPVGVQIIGPWLEDRTPLKLAALIERELGGFVAPKGYAD
ncbi:MAG: amidase [Terricaulis sp.]